MKDRRSRERAREKMLMQDALINLLGGGAAGGLALYWSLSNSSGLAAMIGAEGDATFAVAMLYGGACILGGFLGVCASVLLWCGEGD